MHTTFINVNSVIKNENEIIADKVVTVNILS